MDKETAPDMGPILRACGYEFTGRESISTLSHPFPENVIVTTDFRPGQIPVVRVACLPD